MGHVSTKEAAIKLLRVLNSWVPFDMGQRLGSYIGVHHKHQPLHDKINPKDCQVASPLVIQGFSNCLGLFQLIMANPEYTYIIYIYVNEYITFIYRCRLVYAFC